MRIAYLECFSGISGDMFLGALVDAGVPARVLEEAIAALNVGAALRVSRVDRSGIMATKVDVLVDGEPDQPRDATNDAKKGESEHGRSDSHEHTHEHGHGGAHAHPHAEDSPPLRTAVPAPHEHNHAHHGPAEHAHVHGRHLSEIKRIISAANLPANAKQTAIAIFEALGAAEAKIHNMEIERVHFHEVGAADAMADIVGAAVGAEALGVDEIVCSPLNVGSGTVKCAHGVFPVPAPATVELLKGSPVYSSGVQTELVTPTGAAIVKTLVARFDPFPAMKIEKTGYGAGSRDFARHANVVRLTIGETATVARNLPDESNRDAASRVSADAFGIAHTSHETITVLEANLDDLNPQVIGYVLEKLLAEGALDAFGVPVQMKKNRPGSLLTVLCKPEDAVKLTHILFAETTTLGVRQRDERRQVLTRRWESVATPWGDVRMKIASMNGTITNFAPEYEDCRKIAEERNVPLKTVMLEATQAYALAVAAKKHYKPS